MVSMRPAAVSNANRHQCNRPRKSARDAKRERSHPVRRADNHDFHFHQLDNPDTAVRLPFCGKWLSGSEQFFAVQAAVFIGNELHNSGIPFAAWNSNVFSLIAGTAAS